MPIKTSLTSSEIRKMIEATGSPRDRLIISFYADSGCRVSELLNLTVDQIDLDTREALIRHLKRGVKKKCPACLRVAGAHTRYCSHCGADLTKVEAEGIEERRRIIGLGQETIELLREHTRGMIDSDKIINLTRQQIYNIVREAADRAGLSGKAILNPETGKHHFVHPHDFRTALATDWLGMAGGDVEKQKALQTHLGHAVFDTTTRYLRLKPTKVKSIEDEVRNQRFAKVS